MKGKKVLFGVLAVCVVVMLSVLLASCSDKNSSSKDERTTAKGSAVTQTDSQSREKQTTSKGSSMHQEYVETYYIYAETGAVVTWFDSQTGEYKYKCKCEECGHVSSSEHTNHRLTVQGSSYTSSFTCENSDCIMWGKSQPVKISCNVSGEWVEVYD